MQIDFLGFISQIAPPVAYIFAFIYLIAHLLKEYRLARQEIVTSIDESVDAKLGKLTSQIQRDVSSASTMLESLQVTYNEAQRVSLDREQSLKELHQSADTLLKEATEKLEAVLSTVKHVETTSVSAYDLIKRARNEKNRAEQVRLLTKVLDDPDARSDDLESAGDLARRIDAFSLAQNLYCKAITLDPDDISSFIEYHALLAENDQAERAKHIEILTNIVHSTHQSWILGRIVKVLAHLNESTKLQHLCDEVIKKEAGVPAGSTQLPDISKATTPRAMLAYHSRAIALAYENKLDEARAILERIIAVDPRNEDFLSTYMKLLMTEDAYEKAIEVATELVSIDPLDWNYYYNIAKAHFSLRQYNDALNWLQLGQDICEIDDTDQPKYKDLMQKVYVLMKFTEKGIIKAAVKAAGED